MDCPACGAPATEGRFCARCGAALIQRCPGCSRDNPAGAVFCSHCGARLADEPGAAAAPVATPAGPVRSEGERRQLTVLFCDLVDSTALSAVLDPEDMRAVITAYQSCCAAVVERFEGHLAKYMGDGVLAYFGYPQAHEGDPERAVRAGLELIEAIAALAPRPDLRLEARIGIATGLVVVGDLIGDGSAKEQAVVGETPNLAARLQALAEPGSVVISPRTRRLIGGLFDCEDLGEHQLKGFAGPVELTRVVAPRRVGRFEALRATSLAPMVGREQEIALLGERWQQARDHGEGQVAVLAGEPGIGKSRIVLALQERLAGERHGALRYQCLPYYRNSALQVVIDELERTAGLQRDDSAAAKLDKLGRHLAAARLERLPAAPAPGRAAVDPGGRARRGAAAVAGAAQDQDPGRADGPHRGAGDARPAAGRVRGRALDRSDLEGAARAHRRPRARAPRPGGDHPAARRPAAPLRPGERHRAQVEPARPAPGRGDGRAHDRRPAVAGRGRRTDRGADRWRAAVRRGADQDGAGIGSGGRPRRPLRADRAAQRPRHSGVAPGLADRAPRPPRARQGGGADRGGDRARVLP